MRDGLVVKEKINSMHFFIVILLLVMYLAALVVWPYLGFIILAIVIAYVAYPLYEKLIKLVKRDWLASAIMIFLVFVLIFLPSLFLMKSLVSQASSTIASIDMGKIAEATDIINDKFGIDLDLDTLVGATAGRIKNFMLTESFSVISSVADTLLGIVIMFFALFFLFRDGKEVYRAVFDMLPLKKSHKEVVFGEMQIVTNAVIYGQVIIAIIQGILGGIAFAIFGLENAVFWGFIIAIISFLPLVGTMIIFIPAGLMQLLAGNYVSGLGIIIFGVVLVMNVDSIVRPLIISEKSRLNAALILIGVIGGLKAFGFMGFVIGPLVLALLLGLLHAYRQDFRPSQALQEAQRKKENIIIPLRTRPPDQHRVEWDAEDQELKAKKKD